MKFQHFVLTRFNIRYIGFINQYGWRGGDVDYLSRRFDIFERYCLPAMMRQPVQFTWFVFFSEMTPCHFKEKALAWASAFPRLQPVFLPDSTPLDKKGFAKAIDAAIAGKLEPDVDYVIQTRIDNDDAFNVNALAWIRQCAEESAAEDPSDRFFVVMPTGNAYLESAGFTQRYVWACNHFPTMVLKRGVDDNVFSALHPHIGRLGLPIHKVHREHCWLEVVTGLNAKNDFRPYCAPEYLSNDALKREFAIDGNVSRLGYLKFFFCRYAWARLKWTFIGKRADGGRSRIGSAILKFLNLFRCVSKGASAAGRTSSPKVSVIIPVHNVLPYLRRCLDSVARQTLHDIEVICVDDGSTDGSSALLDEYAAKDRRFSVIHKSRPEGAGAARNDGMEAAKGEYLHFCDSDDFCAPDMLAKMYSKAKATNADVVIAGKTFVDPATGKPSKAKASNPYPRELAKLPQPFAPRDAADSLLTAAKSVPWDKLFRREFIQRAGLRFQRIHRSNDIYFTDMSLVLAERITVVPEELYMYSYRRDGALTGSKDKHPIDTLKAYDAVWEALRGHGLEETFKMTFAIAFAGSMMANFREFRDGSNTAMLYPLVRERLLPLVDGAGRRQFLERCGRFSAQVAVLLDNETPEKLAGVIRSGNKKPLVSVVVPVYNVERYLRRSLDSILGQTLRNIEIVCVDDGSTDGSAAVLDSYARRDSRIVVLSQQNAGAGAARNAGMNAASGEYLFFFDPDDSCEKDMLEVMYRKAKNTKADVVVAGKKIVDAETGELIEYKPLPRRLTWFHRKSFAPSKIADRLFSFAKAVPWDKLFRRAFVEENGLRFQRLPRSNDVYFVDMALALAKRIALVRKGYYRYSFRRGGSLTFSKDRHPFATVEAYDAIAVALKKHGLWETFRASYAEVYFGLAASTLGAFNDYSNFSKVYAMMRERILASSKGISFEGNPRIPEGVMKRGRILLAEETPEALWKLCEPIRKKRLASEGGT